MTVRVADEKDCLSIVELENSCFADAWSEKNVVESISNPNYAYFVLDDNGQILGYFCTLTVADEMELLRIAVAPSARKNGYGYELMQKVVETAKEKGVEKIFLEVRASNTPAINLYSKSGFVEYMCRKKYYQGVEDALLFSFEVGGA